MIYRKLPGTDIKVSALGMGCMRLPVQQTEGNPIDRPEAIKIIRRAIEGGVNYFDTAYVYHGGDSERLLGEALEGGYRDKVLIATKLPVWKAEKYEDLEMLLDEELEKLKTDRVDIYLYHALNKNTFEKLKGLNYTKFMDDMVAKGKVRFPGFSFHDDAETFKEILDSYDWKVCQIQMNMLDEFNQATLAGAAYAASKGIGVIVMEPLRGGAFTKEPVLEDALKLYATMPENNSPAEWAFRWIIDKDPFMTILSGMSTMEQLEENLRIFSRYTKHNLSTGETAMLKRVVKAYSDRVKIGCTGCGYCQPCPQEINIPRIFQGYDRAYMFGSMGDYYKRYLNDMPEFKCVACGACMDKCPQHFPTPIPDMLKQIDDEARA